VSPPLVPDDSSRIAGEYVEELAAVKVEQMNGVPIGSYEILNASGSRASNFVARCICGIKCHAKKWFAVFTPFHQVSDLH
jgi:hypothetical protein